LGRNAVEDNQVQKHQKVKSCSKLAIWPNQFVFQCINPIQKRKLIFEKRKVSNRLFQGRFMTVLKIVILMEVIKF
jgi:hypothetical protein